MWEGLIELVECLKSGNRCPGEETLLQNHNTDTLPEFPACQLLHGFGTCHLPPVFDPTPLRKYIQPVCVSLIHRVWQQ